MPGTLHAAEGTLSEYREGKRRKRESAISPAPQTKLGKNAAECRTEQRTETPHRRHGTGCACPVTLGQRRPDDRVTEACQQTAAQALDNTTEDQ